MNTFLYNGNVLINDNMLMAVIPPAGIRADLMAIIGFLKITEKAELFIKRSEIELIDKEGRLLSNSHFG